MTWSLGLDCATSVMSVAIGRSEESVAETAVTGRRHASAAAPVITQLLDVSGTRLEEIETVVMGDGPGSFTGLRIALATLQGMFAGRDDVTVRVTPSLMATAYTARGHAGKPVAAIYDALRGDVFLGVYRFGESVETLRPAAILAAQELTALPPPRPHVAAGDGADVHADLIRQWVGESPVGDGRLRRTGAALLALARLPGGSSVVDDLATFVPTYGRPAEAQAQWERKHGRALADSPGHYV